MKGNALTKDHLTALRAHYGDNAVRVLDREEPTNQFSDLSSEQRGALISFCAKNGRNWKQALGDLWLKESNVVPLRQIRNQFGPEWLNQLKHVPDYKLAVTLTTADGCTGQFTVNLDSRAQAMDSVISWAPKEPDLETTGVMFSVRDGQHELATHSADGDFWRNLEDRQLTEGVYESILTGTPLIDVIDELESMNARMSYR